MNVRRVGMALTSIAALLIFTGSAVSAQDGSAAPEAASGPVIDVTAVDYAFENLPTSVPSGTSLTLTNGGQELHEMIVVRKNDGVTESFDDLLALPEEEALQKVTTVGVLFAAPGESASMGIGASGAPEPLTSIALTEEGEYFALCAIPQGTTEMPDFGATPMESGAPAGSMAPQGPPHFVLGMRQAFTVTAAGSSPGPLPSAAPV
jgi:hypothetical protein